MVWQKRFGSSRPRSNRLCGWIFGCAGPQRSEKDALLSEQAALIDDRAPSSRASGLILDFSVRGRLDDLGHGDLVCGRPARCEGLRPHSHASLVRRPRLALDGSSVGSQASGSRASLAAIYQKDRS